MGKEQARELKGSRWLWVTNRENLTVEQRGELEVLKRKFPELGHLAEHREGLRQIFEDKRITTPATAIMRLREWCQRGVEMELKALNQFNKTLENWMEKIANYFVSRSRFFGSIRLTLRFRQQMIAVSVFRRDRRLENP